MFLDEKLNDSRSYDEFYNDLEINLIGELKSNISPKPKLSPIHDPECMTSEIGNLNKSENTSLNIFLKKSVYQAINIHAKNDTSREVGGILLGGYYQCENTDNTFLEIKEFIIAKHTESGGAHLTFTHNTWNEINREKDEKYPDLNIVGWYHTHPSFGVFLSGHDRFIQTQYFNEDWQVAYVVDPIRQKRGFLRLKDKNIVNYDGFYLYSNIL